MGGKVIGTGLNHGFAGSYARQPDMVIATRPSTETANPIVFGAVLEADGNGVKNATAALTAATFAGIAAREVKSAWNYADQNSGGAYLPKEPVSVFQRGSIAVLCANGSPALGGNVYVATEDNAWAGAKIGQLSAAEVTSKTVKLPNCQWGGTADSSKVVELVLLTRSHA